MRAVGCGLVACLASCVQVFDLERDPGRCGPGRPFGAGEEVEIGGDYSVEAARFTPSQNQAYLSLCPASGEVTLCDLYSSPFLDGKLTAFSKLTGVSDPLKYDAYPTITPDGEYLLFGSRRMGALQVWVAKANNGSFDAPTITALGAIPGLLHSNEPYLLRDGRTLYLSGQSAASQADDIFRTSGDPPGFGGAAELVPGVASAEGDVAPVVSDDEREMFFSSDRGAARRRWRSISTWPRAPRRTCRSTSRSGSPSCPPTASTGRCGSRPMAATSTTSTRPHHRCARRCT